MFETCECKHTPTRGGTMHASLQTANKREAASLVVAHRLNFPTRKRASAFVLHMFAIDIVCSIMQRLFLSSRENLTLNSLDDSTGAEKARGGMFCKLLPEGMAACDRYAAFLFSFFLFSNRREKRDYQLFKRCVQQTN